jgi:ubiquinone/menaquinone biosynthesis C-methylase UbiE
MAVGDVVASIPISIYGLGTREAALISMFSIYNVIPEKILAFSLFCVVIIWLFPSVIGVIVTAFETKKLNNFSLQDKTIQRFTKYMKKYPELYDNLAVIVKKNIPINVKKPFIVDLGVGPGLLPLHIFKKIPNAKIVGVDPLIKMLEIANENVKEQGFQTLIGKSERIPLKNNSVDIVVSRFSLTYWEQPKKSFIEISRVLKPGGRAILECLNKDFPKWRLFLIKTNMFFRAAGSDVARYHVDAYKTAYSIDSVKKLFSNAGLKIIFEEGDKKGWKFIVIAEK